MPVNYEQTGQVAVITIDRPHRRNAINRETADALLDAWRRFDADDTAAVGILTGAGGHFSAGADLTDFDLFDRPEGFLGFTRLEVTKPTVAAVGGFCVAGGLEMALWCDLRVADQDAVFGCFERRWGVPLVDGGTQRLPRLVGVGRALDMILTGRSVGADEAHRIGLVDRVVPPGSHLDAAIQLANEIASFPQATVRSDRAALLGGFGMPLADGLALERRLGIEALGTAAEGAARFRSERSPRHKESAE
ncbi:MAG: crotonase/enoyl-CoA hydratase family protein [Gammaproteobacteria bacterium]|nr:crotonase/enoyl-CoA hydratase family protein [Gammaproteobacteria bacterium]